MPGVQAGARFLLGRFFAFMMDATTHPNFVHWLAGNLKAAQLAAGKLKRHSNG